MIDERRRAQLQKLQGMSQAGTPLSQRQETRMNYLQRRANIPAQRIDRGEAASMAMDQLAQRSAPAAPPQAPTAPQTPAPPMQRGTALGFPGGQLPNAPGYRPGNASSNLQQGWSMSQYLQNLEAERQRLAQMQLRPGDENSGLNVG